MLRPVPVDEWQPQLARVFGRPGSLPTLSILKTAAQLRSGVGDESFDR